MYLGLMIYYEQSSVNRQQYLSGCIVLLQDQKYQLVAF